MHLFFFLLWYSHPWHFRNMRRALRKLAAQRHRNVDLEYVWARYDFINSNILMLRFHLTKKMARGSLGSSSECQGTLEASRCSKSRSFSSPSTHTHVTSFSRTLLITQEQESERGREQGKKLEITYRHCAETQARKVAGFDARGNSVNFLFHRNDVPHSLALFRYIRHIPFSQWIPLKYVLLWYGQSLLHLVLALPLSFSPEYSWRWWSYFAEG